MNIAQEIKAKTILIPTAGIADTTVTTAVDVELFGDDAMAILQLGAFADVTLNVVIEATAGTSGGSYTTVGTFTETAITTGGEAAIKVDLTGKKFARANIGYASSSTTTSAIISIALVGTLSHEGSDLNSAAVA